MIDGDNYRQYAADCLSQAQKESTPSEQTLVLNVALAWLRLARQTESMAIESEMIAAEQAVGAHQAAVAQQAASQHAAA